MHVPTDVTALGDLAAQLNAVPSDPRDSWPDIEVAFRRWVARPDLHESLRTDLQRLSTSAVASRSKETTTHFAWCLRDRSEERFTFWLHEYKPTHEWRPGYADSVHNHRYHFCTTLLRGGYLHERHRVTLDPATALITDSHLERRAMCVAGDAGALLASDFHRIPSALDGTKTFLVKSRQVTPWSLSFDATTHRGYRHVPVEARVADLAGGI
ncbi:hypothetical protein [Pseudonocardia sp. TRM90224]|uniref:hypothetical protein n=1 Tax=Pseudonocardia sp. TRM90224 TaxID=2812678 RepID=UPI001E2F6970|nr:hypothetical protein [Pseudonocardia sp. TRM90224]